MGAFTASEPRVSDAEPTLEQLKLRNEALERSLKALTKTEQQFQTTQHQLQEQLTCMRALSDFGLSLRADAEADEVLAASARTLEQVLPLEACWAVRVVEAPEGADRPPWRDQVARLLQEGAVELGDVHEPSVLPSAVGRRLLQHLLPEGELADVTIDPELLVVALPILGSIYLVGYAAGPKGGYLLDAMSDRQPILGLLGSHIRHGLNNSRLNHDLKQTNRGMLESMLGLEQTQQHLLRTSKLEAIGRLAGGVAHDFNNLLTVILSHAHFLREELNGVERVEEDLRVVIDTAERAAVLTRQLLAFGRRQERHLENLDLNAVVLDIATMLRRLIGEDIELSIRPSGGVLGVNADRGQIQQILMNLVVNARDASKSGGKIVIETSLREALDGPCARLSVSDNGSGMTHETIERAFEPFFTTKAAGEGTGMGLATVYGIVEQSAGSIKVSSTVGQGTRFDIDLPSFTRSIAPLPRVRELTVRPEPAVETILIVEDEAPIRRATQRTLERAGYHVLTAADGTQALAQFHAAKDKIRLMLCDAVLPGRGGLELVAEMQQVNPELGTILMSGYSWDRLARDGLKSLPDNYLQKPFTPHDLLRLVRRILDAPTKEQAPSTIEP